MNRRAEKIRKFAPNEKKNEQRKVFGAFVKILQHVSINAHEKVSHKTGMLLSTVCVCVDYFLFNLSFSPENAALSVVRFHWKFS